MHERRAVSSGAPWEAVVGYSRGVRVGTWISVAGTTAADPAGGAVGGQDAAEQTREAIRRIAAALEQLGAGLEHVVRTRLLVTDMARWEEVGRAHGEFFAGIRPASSLVEVSALIDPALLVEVEADAVLPQPGPPAGVAAAEVAVPLEHRGVRGRLDQLVLDAREPRALVRFWAGLLGGQPVDRAHGWSHVEPPGFARLAFQPVPEGRVTKNRVHMDIEVDDVEHAVAEALDLGARRVGEVVADEQGSFQVMQDPEGNEFCFVHD